MAISIQIKQSDLSPAAWSALNNAKIKSQFLRDSLEFYVSYQKHFDKVEKDIDSIKEAILSSKIITEVSADIHDEDTINTAETVEQHKNNEYNSNIHKLNNELSSSDAKNQNKVQNGADNNEINKRTNFNNFDSNSYGNSNMTAAKVIENKDNKKQKNVDNPKDDIEDSINNLINSI